MRRSSARGFALTVAIGGLVVACGGGGSSAGGQQSVSQWPYYTPSPSVVSDREWQTYAAYEAADLLQFLVYLPTTMDMISHGLDAYLPAAALAGVRHFQGQLRRVSVTGGAGREQADWTDPDTGIRWTGSSDNHGASLQGRGGNTDLTVSVEDTIRGSADGFTGHLWITAKGTLDVADVNSGWDFAGGSLGTTREAGIAIVDHQFKIAQVLKDGALTYSGQIRDQTTWQHRLGGSWVTTTRQEFSLTNLHGTADRGEDSFTGNLTSRTGMPTGEGLFWVAHSSHFDADLKQGTDRYRLTRLNAADRLDFSNRASGQLNVTDDGTVSGSLKLSNGTAFAEFGGNLLDHTDVVDWTDDRPSESLQDQGVVVPGAGGAGGGPGSVGSLTLSNASIVPGTNTIAFEFVTNAASTSAQLMIAQNPGLDPLVFTSAPIASEGGVAEFVYDSSQPGWTALQPSTTYWWTVRDTETGDAAVNGPFSFSTLPNLLRLWAPADQSVVSVARGLEFEFDDSGPATSHRLLISQNAEFSPLVFSSASIAAGGGLVKFDYESTQPGWTALQPNTTYYWTVREESTGWLAGNGPFSFTTSAPPRLLQPADQSVVTATDSVVFEFANDGGPTSYQLVISESADFHSEFFGSMPISSSGGAVQVAAGNGQPFWRPLQPSTTYYWTVRDMETGDPASNGPFSFTTTAN